MLGWGRGSFMNILTVYYASFVNIKILEKNPKMYNALSNLNLLIILGLLGGGGWSANHKQSVECGDYCLIDD